jgi:hypothetical protein
MHGLLARGEKTKHKVPEIILLTSWQATQGPDYRDQSGDGKHDPDNFRNEGTKPNFGDLPGCDPNK